MPDREKVIKGLEYCEEYFNCCDKCPYWDGSTHCTADLTHDALALLKEQETVEPILIREGRNNNYNDYVCPRCGNEVVYEQNYCIECGIPFLWKGR